MEREQSSKEITDRNNASPIRISLPLPYILLRRLCQYMASLHHVRRTSLDKAKGKCSETQSITPRMPKRLSKQQACESNSQSQVKGGEKETNKIR
jgi:hypothetical protein